MIPAAIELVAQYAGGRDYVTPLIFWALVILLIVLAVRAGKRPCPRCGVRVRNRVMECPNCGFDFRTIGRDKEGSDE